MESGRTKCVLCQFHFRPALRGDHPAAVWTLYKTRFESQE